MSAVARLLVAVLLPLHGQASPQVERRPSAAEADAGLRLVSDQVQPEVIEPGRIAVRRIALLVRDGVTLSLPERMPDANGTEAARTVQVHRQTREGGVLWVLSYPFTAWTPGDHATGALDLQGAGPGGPYHLRLAAAPVIVASPLPAARLVRPAPREDVLPATLPPLSYLPIVPVLLSVLSGATLLRRSRQVSSAAEASPAGMHEKRRGPSLDEVLAARHATGAEAARALAAALRRHPKLVAAGATPSHTTPQINRLVAGWIGGESAAGTAPELVDRVSLVLRTADAAAYGARRPELASVLDAGRAVREALDD